MLQLYIYTLFWLLLNVWLSSESAVQACNERCARCDEGRCQKCIYGWFGHNCDDKCNGCWITGCQRHTGKCDQCSPGRYKEDCGTWCPDSCRPEGDGSVYCRREDGKCLDGCKSGRWGDTCSKPCKHCVTESCLQNNGHCIGDCEVGWYGPSCDKECSVGCRNNKCYWFNGKCTDGCYTSLYGANCTKECSTNCNDSECDMDGWCLRGCIAGFRGKTCNETCPNNCLSCDQDGNSCDECKAHWSGKQCLQMMEKVDDMEEARSEDAVSRAKVGASVAKRDHHDAKDHEKNGSGPRCDWPMLTLLIFIPLSSFRKYIYPDTGC